MYRRLNLIISELSKQGARPDVAVLADFFGVSEKTIRNDIAQINQLTPCKSKKSIEILSDGEIALSDDIQALRERVYSLYEYNLSKEERREILCVILVQPHEKHTIQSLAEFLLVSRNTIIADLEYVRENFAGYGLKLSSVPRMGFAVEGAEEKVRAMLFDILLPYAVDAAECGYFGGYLYRMFLGNANADQQCQTEKALKERIRQWEKNMGVMLTDEAFYRVYVYLLIAYHRVQKKHGSLAPAGESLWFLELARSLAPAEAGEIKALSLFLEAQKYIQPPYVLQSEIVRVQLLIARFLERLSADINMDLNADTLLFHHLTELVTSESAQPESGVRCVAGSGQIEEAVLRNMDVLCVDDKTRAVLAPQIAIYVTGAIRRRQLRPMKVVLICNTGVATANILVEQLTAGFNLEIAALLPSHQADEALAIKADMIISTVELPNFQNEYIRISPVLTGADYLAIQERIDPVHIKSAPDLQPDIGVTNALIGCMPVLEKYFGSKERVLKFLSDVNGLLKNNENEEEACNPMLHEMLPPSHICVDQPAKDCFEAIRAAAAMLLQEGYIEKRYVEAMIRNLKENGPYFVLSDFLAVAHANCEDGVNKTGMSLLRLSTPVAFGENTKPICFVCVLGAVDSKNHLRALLNLFKMIKVAEFRQAALEAKTSGMLAQVLKNYELLTDAL